MKIEKCKLEIKPAGGFTIIELLIATFIVGTVIVGIFGLFTLGLRSSQEGERRVVGNALANERAEMIRNLPYASVGTLDGIPAGSIAQSETIVRNNNTYTVKTDIRYIDDPFDGTAGGNPNDTVNTDYKQARVEVTWQSQNKPKPIILLLTISPAGIEGGTGLGTLSFQALNASGVGVMGASVQVQNTAVSPAVNITTQTDSTGRVVLPGLPPGNETYDITVSKNGYTTDHTYAPTASFTPDTNHTRLSMVASQVTPKTFYTDTISAITITTQDEVATPIGNVAYTLQGTKTIGVNQSGQPVYSVTSTGTTDVAGTASHVDLVWDTYTIGINGIATGYDIKETSVITPITMAPGVSTPLAITLVPHTPISLQISVASPTGQPVDNATVAITQGGFNATLGTGAPGQVLFQNLPANGAYTLDITAPGYEAYSDTVTVTDTTRTVVTLTPSL